MEKQVNNTENEIHYLEKESEKLHNLLSQPEHLEDYTVFEKYEQLKNHLDKMLEQWEAENLEMETWKSKKNW